MSSYLRPGRRAGRSGGSRPRLRSVLVADIPDELIKRERSAESERAQLAGVDGAEFETQWRAWRVAAESFLAAVTEHAAREEVSMSRYELEQAVKKAVRYPEPGEA